MGLLYEERQSVHPFVQAVWRGEAQGDAYIVPSDACWDIIFITTNGRTRMLLAGMMQGARTVAYPAGTTLVGVRFKAGVFMERILPAPTINERIELAATDTNRMWFDGVPFAVPTYETIDSFVSKLTTHVDITRDTVVQSVLDGIEPLLLSPRSVQRHFSRSVGLPAVFINRVLRAEGAAKLIAKSEPLDSVAIEMGFADQAHLSRELKQLLGNTPAQIKRQNT